MGRLSSPDTSKGLIIYAIDINRYSKGTKHVFFEIGHPSALFYSAHRTLHPPSSLDEKNASSPLFPSHLLSRLSSIDGFTSSASTSTSHSPSEHSPLLLHTHPPAAARSFAETLPSHDNAQPHSVRWRVAVCNLFVLGYILQREDADPLVLPGCHLPSVHTHSMNT